MKTCLIRVTLLLALVIVVVNAKKPPFTPSPWKAAHATFYGNPDGTGTMEGACGYGELHQNGAYGVQTAAVSASLFSNGAGCGACFEIRCDNAPQNWCKQHGLNSIAVTATNLCPGVSESHFDLSQPAFLQIAEYKAGIVPIQYRRIPCRKQGGIRFTISDKSNPWFLLVLVWNVGGAGDTQSVLIKGSDGSWSTMTRNWGEFWESHQNLVGQQLSFRVRSSDGRSCTSWRVTPKNWKFGQTYEGKNFA